MFISNLELSTTNSINNSQNNFIIQLCTSSSLLTKTSAVKHSSEELKQGERYVTSPPFPLNQEIIEDVELIMNKLTESSVLNAKDYVYLGSSKMTCFSDMGITLDEQGRLLLIKGNTRDLISGIYHKYCDQRSYTGYTIKAKAGTDTDTFTTLHIDKQGRLIGTNRMDNFQYEIRIVKNTKDYTKTERTESIQISYKKIENQNPDTLAFEDNNGNTMTFRLKNHRIFLSTYIYNGRKYNYDLCEYELKTSLGSEFEILSAKRTRNCLQVETLHNNKKRIYYIDPSEISFQTNKKNRISHKPPQNFICHFGRSPYENYDSGQPFSSTRRGNFSSNWMFLFSSSIDNFRQHIKKSKISHSQGNYGKSFLHVLCAIDPGLRAAKKATVNIVRGWCDEIKDDKKDKVITNMTKEHSSLLAKLPDSVIKNKNFSDALIEFMAKMPEKDSLLFDNISKIALFAGIARGGLPFRPGFFFGLVAAISKTHNITLSKKENGDIGFSFKNTVNTSLTVLAGTGQGSEEIIFKAGGLDLISLLPYEANLILTASMDKEKSTSFNIKPTDMNDFIEKSNNSAGLRNFIHENLEDILVDLVTRYGGRLFLEARVPELRPQIGRAYGKNYAVTPRVAGAQMTTLGISSLSHTRSKETSLKEQITTPQPSVTKYEGISLDIKIVNEEKFMPIKHLDMNGNDFYSPMPLAESIQNHRVTKIWPAKKGTINTNTFPKTPGIHKKNNELLHDIHQIIQQIEQPKTKNNDIKKLTDIKVIYETKRHNLWRNKTGEYIKDVNVESAFRRDLFKIIKELKNKNRNNFDKHLSHSFIATFELNMLDKDTFNHLKSRFSEIKENLNNISIEHQKNTLTLLHRDLIKFNAACQHRIKSIELYGIGSMSESLSTILSGVINISDVKKITYQQHLGDLNFHYHENGLTPQLVQCSYNFIEKGKHQAKLSTMTFNNTGVE